VGALAGSGSHPLAEVGVDAVQRGRLLEAVTQETQEPAAAEHGKGMR